MGGLLMHKSSWREFPPLPSLLVAFPRSAQDLMFPKGEGAFNWASLDEFAAAHTDLDGQTLSFWNPWCEGGDQGDSSSGKPCLPTSTTPPAIDVQNGSSKNYEEQARIDIAAGSPANITILPQPGLLADFAAQGALTDLGDDTTAWLTENYSAGSSWAALGQFDGQDRCRAPVQPSPTSRR